MSDRDEKDWIRKHEPWRVSNKIKETDDKIIQSKSIEVDKIWLQELIDIKGIGEETAKDIVDIYPTKEKLIADLKSGTHVPLNNKHVTILKNLFSIKL